MKLECAGLCKRLGGRLVLDGVSLLVESPGAVALLGRNGAGKSTLLRIVAGVIAPDAGSVAIDGRPLDDEGSLARRSIGYVPEAADPLPHLTVGEYVALTCALKRAEPPPPSLVDLLELRALIDQRMGSLSLGQRRRACLLAALAGAPPLLLLDEPTNGLDRAAVAALAALLERHVAAGGAALVATHDRTFADRVATRTLELHDGRLTA